MHTSALFIVVIGSITAGCERGDTTSHQQHDATAFATEVLGADPRGNPTRYPIVLAPGFAASPTFMSFYLVADALRADGHVVYESDAPPFQSAEDRATYLQKAVDRALSETSAGKVNIIAHSMGGLDARALISSMAYGDRVATLTTIATPHRGTAAADVALGLIEYLGDRAEAIDALAVLFGETFSDVANDEDIRAALMDLAESNADDWNANHPDDPRVIYKSWAGVSDFAGVTNDQDDGACEGIWLTGASGNRPPTDVLGPLFFATSRIVGHGSAEWPNDGLVSVESAKWGEWYGCVPGDHADEIGQVKHTSPDWHTGFDHRRFYRNMAFDLASLGY